MSQDARGHDVVVLGASAGGVEALRSVVAGLPRGFPAAVFVVLHMPPEAPSALAAILDRAGPLPAKPVDHKQAIEPGRIYVARPNRHLVLRDGHVGLEAGPRENSARPAIDVLFRSAARAYGPRVVGVVLSGTLRDGALGLAAIKLYGGVTIVQDPDEALFPGMPESALSTGGVDYRLRAADISTCLVELTHHSLEETPMQPRQRGQSQPTIHAADEPYEQSSPKLPNRASGLTCPECRGSLWEMSEANSLRFECRIGHTFGVEALFAEQGETVEAALWSAINALQERAATFRRLGIASARTDRDAYPERAQQIEHHAAALLDLLRGLIADGQVG